MNHFINNIKIKKQLIFNIYNSINLSKFKYKLIEYENQLELLNHNKYMISPNYNGINCLLIFMKLGSKYYSFLYKNNKIRLVTELATDDSLKKYFEFINKNIHNKKLYYKKVRSILLKREYYSFIERFKNNPFKTLIHYLNYLKLRHLMMIFRR